MAAMASRLGFDPARLGFALRTALAACLGLVVAWWLGLEHPQWSAMTVWAASQPARGLLLEKSLFRALGTVAGVVVGVLLILAAADHPAIVVVGLALWIGACVALGNVLRGFVAYGTILAGYSAAMVALLETAHPGHIFALGLDRLLTVLVGVAAATLVGLLLTPADAEDAVVGEARRLAARLLRAMAARLSGVEAVEEAAAEQRSLLSAMAAIDEALDRHGAGSLRSRRSARQLRGVVAAQVAALLWLRGAGTAAEAGSAIGEALAQAAEALDARAPAEAVLTALRQAEVLAVRDPALHEVLARLHAAVDDRLRPGEGDTQRSRLLNPVILHRDWVGARQAAIRAIGTLLLVGVVWLLTGWDGGPYVMLGTSVMISLFSTAENPALMMRDILIGQIFGAAAALACRWLAWPFATSEWQLILMMLPFIILGAPVIAHRRSMAGGYDYNLIMLLLLQPAYPLGGTIGDSLAIAAAVVMAPAIALVAFRYAFPADARRRRETLIVMMVHELQDMAADRDAPAHARIWQARLRHRLLRLQRWTERTGGDAAAATDGGLAVLQLGSAILHLHALRRAPGITPGTLRFLEAALARLRRIGRDPERARRALELLASRLLREAPAEAEAIDTAAAGLAANPGFFRLASG